MSRILLTPVGSAGDVNPFIWVGRALRARGHDVILVAASPFAASAARAGLGFVAIGTDEDYYRATENPDLWDPRRGLQLVMATVASYLRQCYEAVTALYEPGHTILVGHSLAFATRVFEETHAEALCATIHLSPTLFRSDFEQSANPVGPDLSAWPGFLKHLFWRAVDRFAIDPLIAPPLNAWRAELGLPPVARIFNDWLHSPRRVIGLFPDWFAAAQPDWPSQVRLTGFVLDQGAGGPAVDPELEAFLAEGSPPVVFTPGSANRHAAAFFSAAAGACAKLGTRGLLVTPYTAQVPAERPDAVRHVPYAPFHLLFPRAAAVVHHGGIGTCAQGYAAGVPQLLMPMGYDQPDNAARTARLGAGAWLPPRQFTADRVARSLEALLTNPRVPASCAALRDRMRESRSLESTCEALERLGDATPPARGPVAAGTDRRR